jgi:hypothetical protein
MNTMQARRTLMAKSLFRLVAILLTPCLALSQVEGNAPTSRIWQTPHFFCEQSLAAPATDSPKILAGNQRLIGALVLIMLVQPALTAPQDTAQEPKQLLRQHPVVMLERHHIQVSVLKAFAKQLKGQLDWEKKIDLEVKGRLTPNRIIDELKTRYPVVFPQKTKFVVLLKKDGHTQRWDPEEDLPTGSDCEYSVVPELKGGSDNIGTAKIVNQAA